MLQGELYFFTLLFWWPNHTRINIYIYIYIYIERERERERERAIGLCSYVFILLDLFDLVNDQHFNNQLTAQTTLKNVVIKTY